MPCRRALSPSAAVNGPSNGSADSTNRSSIFGAVNIANSGSTTTRAPRPAASSTSLRTAARFWSLSTPAANCATATCTTVIPPTSAPCLSAPCLSALFTSSEPIHGRHTDDGLPRLIRSRQVDLGGDTPVVVPLRIVKGLPDAPQRVLRHLLDLQQLRPACIGPGEQLVVLGEVALHRLPPGVAAKIGIQLRQVAVPFDRGQFHPAEQRI